MEFDDFFEGMGEDNQSESEPVEETTDTPEEEPATEEQTETADSQTEEAPAEEQQAAEESDILGGEPEKQVPAEESFTLRVNHEDKTVTREEMLNYAQQGVDYSRVKGNLEKANADLETLRTQNNELQEIADIVKGLAESSKISVQEMLTRFQKAQYKSQGYSDKEAALAVERDKAIRGQKKEEPTQTPVDSNQERANREVAEFNTKYPDVQLNEEIVKRLMPDVQGGMTLVDAYHKMQMEDFQAKVSDLETKLAASQKNADNARKTPGSVKDSGQKSKHDMYDDFFDNF